MESCLDVLKKLDEVSFEWVAGVRDLQTAAMTVEELEGRSPGEYVVFDRRTQRIVAKFNLHAASA
jgi:hypothetical protein